MTTFALRLITPAAIACAVVIGLTCIASFGEADDPKQNKEHHPTHHHQAVPHSHHEQRPHQHHSHGHDPQHQQQHVGWKDEKAAGWKEKTMDLTGQIGPCGGEIGGDKDKGACCTCTVEEQEEHIRKQEAHARNIKKHH